MARRASGPGVGKLTLGAGSISKERVRPDGHAQRLVLDGYEIHGRSARWRSRNSSKPMNRYPSALD